MSFTASLDEIVAANANGLLGAESSWARVPLGEVASVLNGFPFASSRFTKDVGTPLLRIRDVRRTTTEAFYDGEVDPQFLVEPGELVVGMDGDFNASLWRGSTAALNQRVCKITPDERWYDRRFLAYVLPGYLDAINGETSSITVKHLSSRTVADIPLPLPPLAEQRRIVAALEEHLSDLDAAVAGLERARANIRRLRAAIIRAAVDGSLTGSTADFGHMPGPDSWSPPVPHGWTWETVDDVADLIEYGTSAKTDDSGHGVPVLRMGNIVDGTLRWDSLKYLPSTHDEFPRLLLKPGDVLFNRTNSPELVGKTAVYRDGHPQASFASYLLRVQLKSRMLPQFLSAYINSSYGRAWVASVVTQQVGQANVNGTKLRTLNVPVPPLDVQRAIVADVERRLTVADRTAADLDAQLARAARLRQAILRRAFEGRLVPQDPADEPAAALLARVRAERAAPVPARAGRRAGRASLA